MYREPRAELRIFFNPGSAVFRDQAHLQPDVHDFFYHGIENDDAGLLIGVHFGRVSKLLRDAQQLEAFVDQEAVRSGVFRFVNKRMYGGKFRHVGEAGKDMCRRFMDEKTELHEPVV